MGLVVELEMLLLQCRFWSISVCFVDYEKAVDRIDWVTLLMDILVNIGVERRERRLIWNLYRGQSA